MWLSLKSAPVFIEKIAEAVSGLDPENRALYKQNALNYIKKIESLDSYSSGTPGKIRGISCPG